MRKLINRLDTFLARFSMYIIIEACLLILVILAIVFAVLGMIHLHPIDMLFCLLVFLAVSLGANYFFAYLFNVKSHYHSALITGGILFFLFSPTSSEQSLIIYSGVAIVAMASKYLLAWRGRHIFNPAALAASVVFLTGLTQASWWASDIGLAVPVSILAGLILYKTQRLIYGAVFLAAYLITFVVFALFTTQPIFEMITATVAAWWPLFFVGFMLSEPLTQPPRRHQYLLIASLVALVIGLHITIGNVQIPPELALVFGNFISFLFARRTGVRLTLTSRRTFPGLQEEFEFKPLRSVKFIAGQYMELMVPHSPSDWRGVRRMFTISAGPESGVFRVVTRYAERSSRFKDALRDLKPGATLSATGVRGDFILPKNSSEKLLFIAGGIGITPFRAIAESLRLAGQERDIVLVYAARNEGEVLFRDEFTKTKGLRFVAVAEDAGGKSDIAAPQVTKDVLQKAAPDIAKRTIYISGPPAMVKALSLAAKELGARTIRTDDFTGY